MKHGNNRQRNNKKKTEPDFSNIDTDNDNDGNKNIDANSKSIQITTEETRVPTKTKQMGNIDKDMKIYVEDYVYTYLYQYGKSKISNEKVALLVGKHYQLNGQDTIVISGAIVGKYSENISGIEFFSNKTWEYMGSEMDKYFPNTSVLGWVHILSGSGGFYTDMHLKLHREFFQEPWQQIFIIDPIEKLDYFYSNKNHFLEQREGYFVYYDKNKEMQEYMLDNSMVKEKIVVEEMDIYNRDISEDALTPPTNDDTATKTVPIEENKTTNEDEIVETNKETQKSEILSDLIETSENLNSPRREDAVKDIKRVMEKRAKEVEQAEKERHTFLVGVSCTLCFLTMCMGVALNNSVKRINNLEGNFQTVQTSYEKLEENLEVKVQAAFAVQQENTPQIAPVTLISTEIKEEKEQQLHIVEEGETLAKISRIYYNTEYKIVDIMAENNITNADFIYVGQKLRIP